jgi:hypothetical protein
MRRQVSRVSRRAKHEAAAPSGHRAGLRALMVYRGSSGCRVIDLFHKLA